MHSNIRPAASPLVPGSTPSMVRITNPRNASQSVNVNVDDLFRTMTNGFPNGPYAACQAWAGVPFELKREWVMARVREKYNANFVTPDGVNPIVALMTGFCTTGLTTGAIRNGSLQVPAPAASNNDSQGDYQNASYDTSSPPPVAPAAPWTVGTYVAVGAVVAAAFYFGKKSR